MVVGGLLKFGKLSLFEDGGLVALGDRHNVACFKVQLHKFPFGTLDLDGEQTWIMHNRAATVTELFSSVAGVGLFGGGIPRSGF